MKIGLINQEIMEKMWQEGEVNRFIANTEGDAWSKCSIVNKAKHLTFFLKWRRKSNARERRTIASYFLKWNNNKIQMQNSMLIVFRHA